MRPTRKMTYTGYGGLADRLRVAIEDATARELKVDDGYEARESYRHAEMHARLAEYQDALDRMLDDAAARVAAQVRQLGQERDRLHADAAKAAADRLAQAERVPGTFAGVRS